MHRFLLGVPVELPMMLDLLCHLGIGVSFNSGPVGPKHMKQVTSSRSYLKFTNISC